MAYYVICEDDCRIEALSREQVLTAIEEAVETGTIADPEGAVISKVKELRANGALQFWTGTEAQFNALSPAPTIHKSIVRLGTNGVAYMCSDDSTLEYLDTIANCGITISNTGIDLNGRFIDNATFR